jgi:hypothetical protein
MVFGFHVAASSLISLAGVIVMGFYAILADKPAVRR